MNENILILFVLIMCKYKYINIHLLNFIQIIWQQVKKFFLFLLSFFTLITILSKRYIDVHVLIKFITCM